LELFGVAGMSSMPVECCIEADTQTKTSNDSFNCGVGVAMLGCGVAMEGAAWL